LLWVCASIYVAGLVGLGVWEPDKLLFALLWPIALPARTLVFVAMLVMVGYDSMS
jgi:hypothetical protein